MVHVAAHQRDRDSQTHRHLVYRADEGQGIHEFLQHQREGEHDHRQDPRNDEARRHFQDHAEAAVPVDHRLLLDLPGDGAQKSHDEPGAKWNGHRRVDQDQRPQRVLEAEQRDQSRERHEQERRRDEVREKDRHAHALAPATRESCQAVPRRHGHCHRDDDHGDNDQQGIQDPAGEVGLPQEQLDVLERRRLVEDPRDVARDRRAHVQVAIPLERRNQHPVERESREHREAEGREVEGHALHRAPTSARRARRSIATATTMRNGRRNTAIAAPWPRSAPRMPRWNARVGSTCVVFAGPPPVRMYTTPRSVAVYTTPSTTATAPTGISNGSSTTSNRRQNPAPSTIAASTISWGIDASPASTITVANGKIRHACTMMMAKSASAGSPSQYSQPWSRPAALSVQLITLNVESKIHVQAIAASETGTAQGRRRTKRANRFPRKVARNT